MGHTRRILYGYLIGTASGIIVGFLTGAHRLLRAALEPLLSSLYTVPKLALLPIFLTVFGFGEKAIVMLIATTVFFFVWISTMAAVVGVADGYREAARSFGVSPWQMFRHVLWPASLPAIFVGMRIAAGVSVLMLIGVEFGHRRRRARLSHRAGPHAAAVAANLRRHRLRGAARARLHLGCPVARSPAHSLVQTGQHSRHDLTQQSKGGHLDPA